MVEASVVLEWCLDEAERNPECAVRSSRSTWCFEYVELDSLPTYVGMKSSLHHFYYNAQSLFQALYLVPSLPTWSSAHSSSSLLPSSSNVFNVLSDSHPARHQSLDLPNLMEEEAAHDTYTDALVTIGLQTNRYHSRRV